MGLTAKKKIILGTLLAGAIVLGAMQTAGAAPWGGGTWCGGCGQGYGCRSGGQGDESTLAARDRFLADTVELRKAIITRKAEQNALLRNDNPDPKRVAELSGELFDLHEQLRTRAAEAGLNDFGNRGPGLGGGCDGKGPGGFQRPL